MATVHGERRLKLSIGVEAGRGVLGVSDNGAGLSAEALPRVFEPFFSTREGGLGLGLSLSETLARGMGGSRVVAPAEPRGARFTLRLPLAQPVAPEAGAWAARCPR